jgi:hypothetical protein
VVELRSLAKGRSGRAVGWISVDDAIELSFLVELRVLRPLDERPGVGDAVVPELLDLVAGVSERLGDIDRGSVGTAAPAPADDTHASDL